MSTTENDPRTGAEGREPTGAGGREPTEEELRSAYEAEIKKIRVEHVLLEDILTLVNLGMRRTGLAAGTEDERDPGQVRMAIESVRALLPLLEQTAPKQVGQIRDALSQLQLAFVKIGGQAAPAGGEGGAGGTREEPAKPDGAEGARPGATGTEEPVAPKPGEPGPAQRSGRLWVPGQ
ncbi:MAG: hypothetical protein JO181_02050 [Solirubrobacterales bacterium]|nr:hypothetical protein [Solirubrobacterales bacterium]